jgi:hypothetical protein
MARLEDLTRDAQVKGVRDDGPCEDVDAKRLGTSAIELTFKDAQGKPGNELPYRRDEPRLGVQRNSLACRLDADAPVFRLVSEAYRIRRACLFEPELTA